jgi:hypothetical protein
MLSYAEHDKFLPPTQAVWPKSKRKSPPTGLGDASLPWIPHFKWIMGRAGVQCEPAGANHGQAHRPFRNGPRFAGAGKHERF